MNKSEMISGIAAEQGLPVGQVDTVIDRFLELVAVSLSLGEEVKLVGFGKFDTTTAGERIRRNPRTGETFMSGPITSVKFRPSSNLKEQVNKTNK